MAKRYDYSNRLESEDWWKQEACRRYIVILLCLSAIDPSDSGRYRSDRHDPCPPRVYQDRLPEEVLGGFLERSIKRRQSVVVAQWCDSAGGCNRTPPQRKTTRPASGTLIGHSHHQLGPNELGEATFSPRLYPDERQTQHPSIHHAGRESNSGVDE